MKFPLKKYVKALEEIFLNKEATEASSFLSSLDKVSGVFEDRVICDFFLNPKVSFSDKEKLLKNLSEGIAFSFLSALIKNKDLKLLKSIIKKFKASSYAKEGKVEAECEYAKEIGELKKEEIKNIIKKKTNKDPVVNFISNPKLIGGAKLRVSSELLEVNFRNDLDLLAEAFNTY